MKLIRLKSLAMKKQEREKGLSEYPFQELKKVAKRNNPVCSLSFDLAIYGKQIGVPIVHEIHFGGA